MRLPNAESLLVEEEKVVGYLLNRAHRYGASKARVFGDFGFTAEHWQALAEACRAHGRNCEVARTRQTPFGPRYEVEGRLYSPDGRNPRVRTRGLATRRGASCAAAHHCVSYGGGI